MTCFERAEMLFRLAPSVCRKEPAWMVLLGSNIVYIASVKADAHRMMGELIRAVAGAMELAVEEDRKVRP